MIFSKITIDRFRVLYSEIKQRLMSTHKKVPYFIQDDPFINRYECLRSVWYNSTSIREACHQYNISSSTFYELENDFIQHGVLGLFLLPNHAPQYPQHEELVLIIKNSRPSLSHTAILRILEALPITQENATLELISNILNSHGLGVNNIESDREFYERLQRLINTCVYLKTKPLNGRDKHRRKETFFSTADVYHKRLELLREFHLDSTKRIKQTCMQFGISVTNFYRLEQDYHYYGPWAIIPPLSVGAKNSIAPATELQIILEKLAHPFWSAQQIVDTLELRCNRFVVNRVLKHWQLEDKKLQPKALDQYLGETTTPPTSESFVPLKTAYHSLPETDLLRDRRINRHFILICKKMKTHAYHICDPGPILIAPFVSDLGIAQAFETYGPPRLRGQEITNLALLNVMRIIGGYKQINHLSDNRDRSVALASGIGMFGSSSKFYEKTTYFKFDQLHQMRCDLVARAKELEIIQGKKLGFDFHFKEFYGSHADEKGIGKGPDKAGQLVPGFRPHVVWDLAENVIFTMAYYQGSVRASSMIQSFCQEHIFSVMDRLSIEEIYMDSEYTKESDINYFKNRACKNGDVYICLKQNKQIKKLIQPALQEEAGWENHDKTDERKTISVILPKTGLLMQIVILRDRVTKENVRCFGSTRMDVTGEEIAQKYRYRWNIENGIKDLVYSYYADQIFGQDPEKIEFEFYCIMVARLAYEYFLKEVGGLYHDKTDGNKYTLEMMRSLIFEKRNCTIEQNPEGNLVLTFLDSGESRLEERIKEMYVNLSQKGKNKVLWWGNKGIELRFKNQPWLEKVSDEGG